MEARLDFERINFNKVWRFPKPKRTYDTIVDYFYASDDLQVNQQKFLDEYYVSGHKIYDKDFLPDYYIEKKGVNPQTKKEESHFEEVHVERISLPVQEDSTRVLLAHMFGRGIQHKDISFDKNDDNTKLVRNYKEVWDSKNMDSAVKKYIKHALICAEAAMYFYINKDGEIQVQILSLLNKDRLAAEKDSFGNITSLYRKYVITNSMGEAEEYIDHITMEGVGTYNDKGELIHKVENKLPIFPIVYKYRKEGAWWSSVQPAIDELEKMLSMLAEDNKSKAKSKLHLATQKPNNVKAQTLAGADVIITGVDGKVNLLQPANLSESLKFIIERLEGQIEKTLGLIYPKLTSGDLPTGSMKLAFFPTERICKDFIDEFSPVIDEISKIFKKCLPIEFKTFRDSAFSDIYIKSKIALYSPQDSLQTLTASADAYSKGALTEEALVRANSDYMDSTDLEKMQEAIEEAKQQEEQQIQTQLEESKATKVIGLKPTQEQ